MDQSQLLQAPITAQFTQDNPATPPPTHSPGGFAGWFDRNAQTIGSIALPVLADVLTEGAATPLDPLLSGIGGAGGQEVKNLTTGTTTSPLEEGLISGGLSLAGGAVGKGISKVAGKVVPLADRYGTNLLSQVGGSVDKTTSRALDLPTTVRLMTRLGVKPNDYESTSQEVMNILNPLVKKGINSANPVDLNGIDPMIEQIVNGENGLNGMADQVGTPANKLTQNLKAALNKVSGVGNPYGTPLSSADAASTTNILRPAVKAGDISDYIDQLNREVANSVKKYKGKVTAMPADEQAINNVKSQLAKNLELRLYTDGSFKLPTGETIQGAAADSAVAKGGLNKNALESVSRAGNRVVDHGDTVDIVAQDGSRTTLDRASFNKLGGGNGLDEEGLITPEVEQQLRDALPNTPFANRFINALKNGDTIGELRSGMYPFLNASKIAAAKEDQMATAGASGANSIKKPFEWATGLAGLLASGATGGASALIPAGELALGTDTGKTLVGRTLTGSNWLGNLLRGAPDESQAVKVGRNLLIPGENKAEQVGGRHIIQHLGRDTLIKSIQQTLPRTAAAIYSAGKSTNVTNVVDTAVNEAMSAMPSTSAIESSNNGVLSASQFQQLESQYGNTGINAYMNWVRMTQPQLTQEQQTNWIQGQTLLSRLKQVAQLYSQSNAGPISGRLSELSGAFGSKSGAAAQTYDAQRDELATTLVRFVNEGGGSRGGAQLTSMLRKELPTLGDSAQSASTKFAALVQAVVLQMQNNLAGPATNTPGQLSSFAGANPAGGSAGTPSVAGSNILNFLPPSMVGGF